MTAFDAVVLQAGLGSGDTLLVNGGSGGVGTAAVQIGIGGGRHGGGERAHRAAPARGCGPGRRGAPADQAFERVAELGGADVILELVGGPHMDANVASLARGGRLMLVAAKPGEEAHIVLRDLMMRRGHLIGTTLRTRPPEEKALLTQTFGRRMLPLLAAGTIAPIVDRSFPLEDAAEAFDAVREPGKFGKLLLEMPG